MLYTILTLLVFFWFVGFLMHVGGPLIHTILLLAGIIYLVDLIRGRRAV